MDYARGFAEKAKKDLRVHPELRDALDLSFDRLIRFLGLSRVEANKLKLIAGLTVPGYTQLSISTDERIYDILDTYELGKRLRNANGSWDRAWESIKKELDTPDPVYGVPATTTLEGLRVGFDEVRKASGNDALANQLFFENFVRDTSGNLIILA